MDQRRVNIHFNLDHREDRLVYDYLVKGRDKLGPYAKELLLKYITLETIQTTPVSKENELNTELLTELMNTISSVVVEDALLAQKDLEQKSDKQEDSKEDSKEKNELKYNDNELAALAGIAGQFNINK